MGSSEMVREFEDRRWATRKQEVVWRHRAALQLIEVEPVLDVGGGDGLFVSLLKEKGLSRVQLVDISPVAVKLARERGFDASIFDATQPLPFGPNAFGTVCGLDLLEHLHDPLPVLRDMARVGGHVVVVVPNFHYWKDRVQMMLGQVPFQCRRQRGHVYWFNYRVLLDLIREAGLTIDRLVLGGTARLARRGALLARLRPNVFATGFAVRLKKRE